MDYNPSGAIHPKDTRAVFADLRVLYTRKARVCRAFFVILFPDTKFLDQFPVSFNIFLHYIIEKATALADQAEQSETRGMVFLVRLEVVGQPVDALGKKRDLCFRRTGIFRGFCRIS
jgi:hypothetical protein